MLNKKKRYFLDFYFIAQGQFVEWSWSDQQGIGSSALLEDRGDCQLKGQGR